MGCAVLVGIVVGEAVGAIVAVRRGVDVEAGALVGAGIMVGTGSGVLSCAVQAASRKSRTNCAAIFIVFVSDFISIDIGLQ